VLPSSLGFIEGGCDLFLGSAKLGIENNNLHIVVEKDGTLIDEDDVLVQLKDEIFMLLVDNDIWRPQATVGTPLSSAGKC